MKFPVPGLVLRAVTALFAAGVLAVGLSAAVGTPAAGSSDLQLVVAVPPSARPTLEMDAADSLSGVIQQNLARRGYPGTVRYPGNPDAAPSLKVSLVEWRPDPLGSIKCTITASVRTAAGTKDLGLFTGTSLGAWNGGRSTVGADALNRADAYEEAANEAFNSLAKTLAKDGALPGFAKQRK
jgi:hypothetical protein